MEQGTGGIISLKQLKYHPKQPTGIPAFGKKFVSQVRQMQEVVTHQSSRDSHGAFVSLTINAKLDGSWKLAINKATK